MASRAERGVWTSTPFVLGMFGVAALFATWVQLFFVQLPTVAKGTIAFGDLEILSWYGWALSPVIFGAAALLLRPSRRVASQGALVFFPLNSAGVLIVLPVLVDLFRKY